MPLETGYQGTPPFLSPPRAPGSRVPQHVDTVCRVLTDGRRWVGTLVVRTPCPGSMTRLSTREVALAAKDDH